MRTPAPAWGLNSLRLPLPNPMTSPFGIEIREMVIPGHLAPQSTDPVITELAPSEGGFRFRVEDRHIIATPAWDWNGNRPPERPDDRRD